MSDIEHVANTLQEHGGFAASAVAGLYAAKKLFGPSLDAVGTRLKEVTEKRLENLGKISAKADLLAGEAVGYPHVRVAQRILNDATLYDDDLQHTYVAGMLAGSRNADGSDDRPIYYLDVIDGLTSAQLRLFHVLYSTIAALHEGNRSPDGPIGNFRMTIDRLNAHLALLGDDDEPSPSGFANIFALEHAGLIRGMSMKDDVLSFNGTRIGALLFDWAYGFNDDDVSQFGLRIRPDIGLPHPPADD